MQQNYNVFNGFLGLCTFILAMLAFISHDYVTTKNQREQIQKIEELTNKVEMLTCSVDSLENYLCD